MRAEPITNTLPCSRLHHAKAAQSTSLRVQGQYYWFSSSVNGANKEEKLLAQDCTMNQQQRLEQNPRALIPWPLL